MGSIELLFGLRKEGESEGLWVGHSVFQLPVTVQRYKGSPEALVLAYLYQFASGFSFHSDKPVVIEFSISQEKIAERTGLSLRVLPGAIQELEADKCIRVERTRDERGRVTLSVYLLLHSTTQEPLWTTPNIWGVCHQNGDRPFITAPKELLKVLMQLQPGARAVYLSALSMASVRIKMSFKVTPEDWKAETLLGRNAFNRGKKECVKRGLLKYNRQVLTLHDPATGKPSTKERQQRVYHKDAQWKFSLDDITGTEWQKVAEDLFKRSFTVGAAGWTHTTPDNICPFCKEGRAFTMHFEHSQWKCHQCRERGRIFQLLQRVQQEPQAQRVREYITAVLAPEKETADTRTAVLAGSVEDI
jgi:hypothetical protein